MNEFTAINQSPSFYLTNSSVMLPVLRLHCRLLYCIAVLGLVSLVIQPMLFQKLLMGSPLFNPPVFQENYFICIPHRRNPVGNNYLGGFQCFQGFLK